MTWWAWLLTLANVAVLAFICGYRVAHAKWTRIFKGVTDAMDRTIRADAAAKRAASGRLDA